MDKDLGALRKARWEKAFNNQGAEQQQHRPPKQEDEQSVHSSSNSSMGSINKRSLSKADAALAKDALNRKATIVIEHLIQASDVAHTMQVSLLLLSHRFVVFLHSAVVEEWSSCCIVL
jgi:hypothetical protein